MGRPLRLEIKDGLYHVINLAGDSGRLFPHAKAFNFFADLIAQSVEYHQVQIHAFCLVENSCQLVIQTPLGNLSQMMQWLSQLYSTWANREFQFSGSLFKDRYRAILIEGGVTLLRVSRHVHLMPIRSQLIAPSRLDSSGIRFFDDDSVRDRLRQLREYRWSSYRSYAGYVTVPEWLYSGSIYEAMRRQEKLSTGPARAYRLYVEQSARIGIQETILDHVKYQMFLGQDEFVARMRRFTEENPQLVGRRPTGPTIGWDQIIRAVEQTRGKPWVDFVNTYGDPGRDLALFVGRTYGGYSLKELGAFVGGLGFTAIGQAITRMQAKLQEDPRMRSDLERIKQTLKLDSR